ncbi:MAG TPA: nuclear transport factor 2 family protein [bacterium]|jgi:ketosteroid isomerase-like protein|nr:nuclear transport factor 2 family protein [bacterium]
MPADLKKVVKAHLEALNARNLDRLVSYYADDATLEFPASPPARGKDRIRRAFGAFFDQWDETSQYRAVLVAGRAAAAEGRSVGRHRTLQLRIPGRVGPTAGGYRHDFAMFLEFRGGLIVRHRVYYDARELVKQLLG